MPQEGERETEAIRNANFCETGFGTFFTSLRLPGMKKRSKENSKLRIFSLLKYLELFAALRCQADRGSRRNNLELPNNKITRHFDGFKFKPQMS